MPTAASNVRRVLFVDDDAQFLETIKGLMTAFSGGLWEISIADSASRAFSVLQDQPMDMIVVDVQMGVMDGVQMLSLLNRGYPNVQKVVLTGYANEKYRAACLSNGAELFLEKPSGERGWENLFTVLDELAKFKPEEGFRGVLRRVGIQDVLQMECLARSSSVLEISNAQLTGQIFVETGQIIHAQVGELAGEAAFNRLMAFSGGQFNLKPFKEPSTRSLSGPWEFLIMEAARQRDEDAEAQAVNSEKSGNPPATVAAEPLPELETSAPIEQPQAIIAPASSRPPEVDLLLSESTVHAAAKSSRPKIEEFLICTAEGEVLHEFQCRNVDVWVSFIEFLSQRAQRIEQALPLGDFERLEILSGESRAVIIIGVDKGVMVKTTKEAVA